MLVLLTTFLGSSCTTPIKFDPDFYVPQVAEQALINEDGVSVSFDDPQAEMFGCMGPDKLKELAEILTRARMPKKAKRRLMKSLREFRGARRF